MRRLIALTLLILTTASAVEAMVGELRDGEVHHEDAATAFAHAERASGEHGHEDESVPASHDHGQGHEHGTAADHCTHAHGWALLTEPPPALLFTAVEPYFSDTPLYRGFFPSASTHPPRV